MINLTLAIFLLISDVINSSIHHINTLIFPSQLSPIIPLITQNDSQGDNNKEDDDEGDVPILPPKYINQIKL
ncbi:MAG: hypothetical protein AB4372_39675 [Xenococcus sp. (in: cyanobacteria)]